MTRKKFGEDPMDLFSKPVTSALETIFELPERRSKDKPGRVLRVLYDSRVPLVPDFKCRFVYCVTLDKKGSKTDCHYHKIKQEMIFCTHGSVKVLLYEALTKWHIMITLDAVEHKALYIRHLILHQVLATSDGAVVTVLASAPNTNDDEFKAEFPPQLQRFLEKS